MKHFAHILLLGMSLALAACASTKNVNPQDVQTGTVESAQPATIEGTMSATGTSAGALVGVILGSKIGHGQGSAVGAAVGAVAGGAAAPALEENLTRKEGQEITVSLDNGRRVTVFQEGADVFKAGDRVKVFKVNGEDRVSH